MRSFKWLVGFTVVCAAAGPAVLCAEEANTPPAYFANGAHSPVAVYVAAARVEGDGASNDLGQRVDNASLANMSGGTMVIQNTNLDGTVSNNSADHVISGDNTITGGSFAGEVGIPVVIQNSGSNVLIQNATVLNVQFKP